GRRGPRADHDEPRDRGADRPRARPRAGVRGAAARPGAAARSGARALSAFLAALQLADSALPVGRFAHSAGLESLVAAGSPGEEELYELAESHVVSSVAPLDGAALAHAHR